MKGTDILCRLNVSGLTAPLFMNIRVKRLEARKEKRKDKSEEKEESEKKKEESEKKKVEAVEITSIPSSGFEDRLDGLSKRRHLTEQEKFDEYLQLPDDYQLRGNSLQPGRKRVRWADIEERADQERQRNLGFVVGHTDWNKMLDDNYAHRALNRTKYF